MEPAATLPRAHPSPLDLDTEVDGLTKSVQRVGLVYLAIWEQAVSGRLFPETQAFILKVTRLILEMFRFSKTKRQMYETLLHIHSLYLQRVSNVQASCTQNAVQQCNS